MREGGILQQSAIGGFNSASSSISVRSFGRSYAQTLSSLSTARPVIPPIFHLFGSGFGQSGSNLNFGTASSVAPITIEKWFARKRLVPSTTAQTANKVRPATLAQVFVRIQGMLTESSWQTASFLRDEGGPSVPQKRTN